MVINAVVKEFHNKQNKIVVKIGKTNELVRQEYNVAKKLNDTGEPIIMDFDTSAFVSQSASQWRFWADMHRIIGIVIEKGFPSNPKSYAVSNALSIYINYD